MNLLTELFVVAVSSCLKKTEERLRNSLAILRFSFFKKDYEVHSRIICKTWHIHSFRIRKSALKGLDSFMFDEA